MPTFITAQYWLSSGCIQNPNTGYKPTKKCHRQLALYWFTIAEVLIIITGKILTKEVYQPLVQCWLSAVCKQNPNTGSKPT